MREKNVSHLFKCVLIPKKNEVLMDDSNVLPCENKKLSTKAKTISKFNSFQMNDQVGKNVILFLRLSKIRFFNVQNSKCTFSSQFQNI